MTESSPEERELPGDFLSLRALDEGGFVQASRVHIDSMDMIQRLAFFGILVEYGSILPGKVSSSLLAGNGCL